MGASQDTIVFNSCVSSSNLTALTRFLLPPERAYFYLCGRCEAYFLEYSLSTLHSLVDCPGPCTKHVFSEVDRLLRWPAQFLLCLPACTFLGLVGDVASTTLLFLIRLAQLVSDLMMILEGVPTY